TLMIVAAPSIIGFLYHQEQYIHSVPALQMLAPGLLFLYANTVLGSLLMSIKQEKKITIMAAIALVFNLGLNLVLIPRYEHVGAAAVTSFTELLLLCLSIAFTPREFLPFKSLITGAKSLLACLAMSLAIWKLLSFNIFVILPVGIVVYGVVILLSGAIPREDFTLLLQAVRQKATGSSSSDTEQEEQSSALEQMLQLADEDTIPMKAVYRLQQLQPNIDLAMLDTLLLKAITHQPKEQRGGATVEDEDTWRLKADARNVKACQSGSLEEEKSMEKEEREILPLKSRVLEQIGQDIEKLIEDTNALEEDESMDTVPSRVIRRPKKEVGAQQTLKE
ncbi:MAG TPA: polysaccharide biosynthesis C-terminal domain-containing protein, partial [Ktedonobacteraceae bacterium]|nr:polysaccharide biosynthesis C-terminal domain-containing protein [Ktedonobacteraceae bacterium]